MNLQGVGYRCELPEGHTGLHEVAMRWDDKEATGDVCELCGDSPHGLHFQNCPMSYSGSGKV